MASFFVSTRVVAVAAALTAALFTGITSSPAARAADGCGAYHNLWKVHNRTIDLVGQINRDARDYGGHKSLAAKHVVAARLELEASRRFAVDQEHANPQCFVAEAPRDLPALNGRPNQAASNNALNADAAWLTRLISQLRNDNRDFGGHRANAINELVAAQTEVNAALAYAQAHNN